MAKPFIKVGLMELFEYLGNQQVEFFNNDNEPGIFSVDVTETSQLMFNYSLTQAPILNSIANTMELSLNVHTANIESHTFQR
eukprot:CAMPEP_0202962202 /NCGR_PEP_ID=MMETSP1396-20130829/6296_1 /ASSEMBLY_ACC=CAM_ASM_000872 /TAXON_ID= /ORGANISM="Pseudokeronopsis sp., Strain Brazil" /LENGTH=81 /DNA_ID=CAMNT_0049682607 /DNA_START=602 /DNA_END=847 /DNA_ORIENTATION=-